MLETVIKPILLTLIFSVALGCNSTENSSISPTQAAELQHSKQALIIDVRELQEWNQHHIPGAMNIPLAQLSTRLSEIEPYKNKPVILQCQSGGRSGEAVTILKSAGFTQVSNMAGGLLAWIKAGLKTD